MKTKQPPGQRELRPIGSRVRAPGKTPQDRGKPTKLFQVRQLGPTFSFPAAEPDPPPKKKNLRILKAHAPPSYLTPTKTERKAQDRG